MTEKKFKLVPNRESATPLNSYQIESFEDQYNGIYNSKLKYKTEHNKEKAEDIMWNLNYMMITLGYKFREVN
jgi:CRISPR/Cas system CSM-associated protein Csm2 small subunit